MKRNLDGLLLYPNLGETTEFKSVDPDPLIQEIKKELL
ncbi:MAG: hypothetical protein ACJATA_000254 [Sphingobacteriales bacterium]|jgi:hypothetical protein